ncbi:MAG: NRDE family protein [Halopseudomonas sp.]
MCLILFAYKTDPRYQLIVAANRDEFYDRPTRRLDYWPEAPRLLAGQDLEQGGTWLGITRCGRFAAITNVRQGLNPSSKNLKSRGHLPLDFLLSDQAPLSYLETLQQQADDYAGYNLLLGDRDGLYYGSNRNQQSPQQLTPGVYGLSNACLNTPWPKVAEGAEALQQLIDDQRTAPEPLLQLLQQRDTPADQQLPDTGVGLEWERRLGPRFIESERYGTRSSLVLLSEYDGDSQIHEQSYTPHWEKPKSYYFSTE